MSDRSYWRLAFWEPGSAAIHEDKVRRKRTRSRRKTPQQARSRDTVRVILDAATRVLSRQGYDQASTNRIAEVAGVSIGSLYQFFPNKESIFAALRERYYEELAAVFEAEAPRLRNLAGRESLRLGLELVLRARRQNPALQRALDQELPFSVSTDQSLDRLGCGLALERLSGLPAAVRPPNLEMAARMSVTIVDSITRMACVQYPEYLESEEFLDEATELVWRFVYRDSRRPDKG